MTPAKLPRASVTTADGAVRVAITDNRPRIPAGRHGISVFGELKYGAANDTISAFVAAGNDSHPVASFEAPVMAHMGKVAGGRTGGKRRV